MFDAKKSEILQAAHKAFAHYGFDKTTLDDIGKLTGLNKASLYYYYKSKEAMFIDVIRTEIEQFISHVRKKNQRIRGYKPKIIGYLRELFSYSGEIVNINKLSMETMKSFRPLFMELTSDIIQLQTEFLADILLEARNNGEIVDCDTKRVASSIVTIIQAVKSNNCQSVDCNIPSNENILKVQNEMIFTVSLVLDGLSHKQSHQ